MADIDQIKKLREETSASIADCRQALDESNGDYKKALAWLKKRGIEKADKKAGRETKAGIVDTYIHHTLTSGATVALTCETDFVARTPEFKNLAHEITQQITATNPDSIQALLDSLWIRDEKKRISDLIKENIAKLGENIEVKEFKRFET